MVFVAVFFRVDLVVLLWSFSGTVFLTDFIVVMFSRAVVRTDFVIVIFSRAVVRTDFVIVIFSRAVVRTDFVVLLTWSFPALFPVQISVGRGEQSLLLAVCW